MGIIFIIRTINKGVIVSVHKEFIYISKKKEPLNRKKWLRIWNRKFTFLMDNKHIKGCLNLLQFFKSKPKEKYFYQSDCQCVLVEFDKNPVVARAGVGGRFLSNIMGVGIN